MQKYMRGDKWKSEEVERSVKLRVHTCDIYRNMKICTCMYQIAIPSYLCTSNTISHLKGSADLLLKSEI